MLWGKRYQPPILPGIRVDFGKGYPEVIQWLRTGNQHLVGVAAATYYFFG